MSDVLPLTDFDGAVARATDVLRAGDPVVVPSDSVYALVGDAFQLPATQRMFEVRAASRDAPLTVLVRSPRQVDGFVERVPERAERLMAAYWPGPLTLIFEAVAGLAMDLGDARGTVSIRMPAEDLLLALVGEVGPLACTAATRPGQLAPTTVSDAQEQFGDEVALYLDGGVRAATVSTVVDVAADPVRVLRDGAVPAEHVHRVAAGVLPWGRQPDDVEGEHPTAGEVSG